MSHLASLTHRSGGVAGRFSSRRPQCRRPGSQHHPHRLPQSSPVARRATNNTPPGGDPRPDGDEERPSTSGSSSGSDDSSSDSGGSMVAGIPAVLLLFVSSAAWTATNLRDELGDLLAAGDDDDGLAAALSFAGLGLGDIMGALLWSAALWYASPVQLLLVFFGVFEAERPSDWVMKKLGRAASLPVDDLEYAAPLWVRGTAVAACLAGGVTIAALLGSSLGDPTWSISSGIGALFAAAVFEAGRPKRLTVPEAKQLEAQWQDFAAFADARLQRSGRCHESEVFNAFRRSSGKYRSPDTLADSDLRSMVRNWAPAVERTRTGYLRNVSIVPLPTPAATRGGSSEAQGGVSAAASSGSALLDSIAAAAASESDDEAVPQDASSSSRGGGSSSSQ